MNCCCIENTNLIEPKPETYSSAPTEATPTIQITLDLPYDPGYRPTYWPGQTLTGHLHLHPHHLTHLHDLQIILFGHIQIKGPASNGLFSYERNDTLLHLSQRVTRISGDLIAHSCPRDRRLAHFLKTTPTHLTQTQPEFDLTRPETVSFRFRIPSGVVHTFDHPVYPIQHQLAVILQGTVLARPFLKHQAVQIRLESCLRPEPILPVKRVRRWRRAGCLERDPVRLTRGDRVGFRVRLELAGRLVGFRVSLRRQIWMSCSMNEVVEDEVVDQVEVGLGFGLRTMTVVEVDPIVRVPVEAVCSIPSGAVRDVLSLQYVIMVEVVVVLGGKGEAVARVGLDRVVDRLPVVPKMSTLQLGPLPVFVGNSKD